METNPDTTNSTKEYSYSVYVLDAYNIPHSKTCSSREAAESFVCFLARADTIEQAYLKVKTVNLTRLN